MRSRTRLTTPGGQEPEAIGKRTVEAEEVYSQGFAIPVEPRLPARWPWVAAAMAVPLLLVALIYLFLSVAGVEEQDPSLGEVPSEAAGADS